MDSLQRMLIPKFGNSGSSACVDVSLKQPADSMINSGSPLPKEGKLLNAGGTPESGKWLEILKGA